MLESEPIIPKTFNSQIIITMTTTMFKMLLILLSIGTNLLTNHKRNPAKIMVIRMLNKGMEASLMNNAQS
jgi:hypothetical protein